ncbi:MAG: dynamin family protein [Alphaproteobacteria bacterium]|nr:dynamin family protein [Alphaproteobacteria bacterium]
MTSVLDDFVRRRERAATVLDTLADSIGDLSEDRHATQLRLAAARARQGRFVVLLLGCFSSGKSTLLNALLGRPVLPVKVNPCTAILTEVVHGEEPGVDVRFRDGRVEAHTIESFLEAYQLRTGSEEEAGAEVSDRFGDVDRAVVRWPLDLLEHGVVLLDTPGLDDDPTRTARTLSSLPDADAVIFTLSANRFLTELERKTLRRDLLPLGLTNLFFPTTMVDLLQRVSTDPEGELARIRAQAAETLGPLGEGRFFPLNARGALQARWDRSANGPRDPADEAGLESTGMAAFEDALETFLIEERGSAQLRHLLGTAKRIHDELGRQAGVDRATAETSVEELKSRQAELEPKFEELARIQSRVARTVDHFISRTKTVIWQDLRDLMARAEHDLPDAVAEFDLGGLAGLDLITESGRARVESRLRNELEQWLEGRVRQWQVSLEPKLEKSLSDLRNELAADARDFDDIAVGIVTDFAGGAFALPAPEVEDKDVDPVERWFSVAVGALLLSPGTVAAGWSEGYEGAMKGAAGRLGVRLAILGIGALLGPIGWVGLLLYAISDAVLLFLTGGQQLRRLRGHLAQQLEGRLVGQADAAREEVEARVAENLRPIRDALVAAAGAEAEDVRALLDQTIRERETAIRDAASREAHWTAVLETFDREIGELTELAG